MRRPFVLITVLALFLGVLLTASRDEARHYTRMALADLSVGQLPGRHIASDFRTPNIDGAILNVSPHAWASDDGLLALARLEMKAAGVLKAADAETVSMEFEALAGEYPDIPLFQYRCGAYLLGRLQAEQREFMKRLSESKEASAIFDAQALPQRARTYLARAAKGDMHNSLPYYETAFSYLMEGDSDRAAAWFAGAVDAQRLDSGDDVVFSGVERLLAAAQIPELEAKLAKYRVTQFAPSLLSVRLETLVSAFTADRSVQMTSVGGAFGSRMMGIEDLSEKLFANAYVLRETQASLVTAGLLWSRAAREAAVAGDKDLLTESRRRLAEASYRYVLTGWQRAEAGLPAQQNIVELDTPVQLRLPFSAMMQRCASVLVMVTAALALGAMALGVAAMRWQAVRQGALALGTLSVFAFLAYAGAFTSLSNERARVDEEISKRLSIAFETPEYLRQHGQAMSPADYVVDVPKQMIGTFDYTFQSGRVLAYVGTRDCYDLLIEALDNPDVASPAEVAAVLREATGLDFGYRVTRTKAANYEAVRAWKAWWRENRMSYPETVEGRKVASQSRTSG